MIFLNSRDSIEAPALVDHSNVKSFDDRELRRQKLVDERHVVVKRSDLEELLPAETEPEVPVFFHFEIVTLFPFPPELAFVPTLFDVSKELHPELVRIQVSR